LLRDNPDYLKALLDSMKNHNVWLASRSIASIALCATHGCFVNLTGSEEAVPNNADNKAGPSRAADEAGTNVAVK
jgi:hypothetical protein